MFEGSTATVNSIFYHIMYHAAGAEVKVSGESHGSNHTYKWIWACRILGRSFEMEYDNIVFSRSS